MATESVPDDNAIYLQATEGVHKLKVRIDDLVEKNTRLNVEKKRQEEDFRRLKDANKETEEELLRLNVEKKRQVEDFRRLKDANKETEDELLRASREKVMAIEENLKRSEKCRNMESLLNETLDKNQNLEKNVKDKHHSLKKELNDWKKKCSQMETTHHSLTNDVQKERRDKEDAIRSLKQIEQKRKDTEATLKQYEDAFPKLQTEKTSWESAYNEQLRNIQHLQQQCQIKDENYNRLNKQNQSLLQEKRSLEETQSRLILRLRIIAGFNLTTADLSDENRPTKVTEKFSELFDNEWTDAFEQVNEKLNNEERGVENMLDILQFAFTLCNEISATSMEKSSSTKCRAMFQHQANRENISQECTIGTGDSVPGQKCVYKKAQEHVLGSDSVSDKRLDGGSVSGDKNNDRDPGQSLSEDSVPGRFRVETDEKVKTLTDEFMVKLLNMKKEIGFNMTGQVREELTTVICKRFDISTDIDNVVPKYISKCIELCWYMRLQNPPVFMKFEEMSDGIQFDRNTYKPYTKYGKHIAYVVWPPLFLHKDGSMLSKGVAQGSA